MRTRSAGGLAVAAGLVLFSVVLLSLIYIASVFGGCEIVRLKEFPSPDGSKSVVVFRKECGATVPYNTQASIASKGVPFSPERAPPFLIVRDIQDVHATWSGEKIVGVRLTPGASTVYKRDQNAGDVRIEYE